MVAHVADFGIGKLISADKLKEHVSTTGFLLGSIGYIPPEYGQGIEVSAKGDVYSFGVMLLEMITRRRPTSNMYYDGLDLRKWVSGAFPGKILDVVDTTLKQDAYLEVTHGALEELEQCSIQMLDVGMMCREDNPHKRPPMSSVVKSLKKWQRLAALSSFYLLCPLVLHFFVKNPLIVMLFLNSWNEANPFCNWTGITCHPHLRDRVIGLELIDMVLQGGISP
ncbi:PREDICTED: probable LRR receptor [Prunus dulcis]|uniref:PREDICTED: probable LRR receptor n=1 Tax=Prunus dulcis TaxID=3755 RepID=A0A5E4EAA6_PRUDU|nr:PREDICTED: probable LRR receptor [Prunus dulcis]